MSQKFSSERSDYAAPVCARWEALQTWGAGMLLAGALTAAILLWSAQDSRPSSSAQFVISSTSASVLGAESSLAGYALMIVGYLLLPGVGVLLMRRKRAVARSRAAVLSASATDGSAGVGSAGVDDASTACSGGLRALFRFAVPCAKSRRVDAAAPRVAWEEAAVQCAVCLADVEAGDDARVLPCRHAFHTPCADLWLVTGGKKTCPLCMHSVFDNSHLQHQRHHHTSASPSPRPQ